MLCSKLTIGSDNGYLLCQRFEDAHRCASRILRMLVSAQNRMRIVEDAVGHSVQIIMVNRQRYGRRHCQIISHTFTVHDFHKVAMFS